MSPVLVLLHHFWCYCKIHCSYVSRPCWGLRTPDSPCVLFNPQSGPCCTSKTIRSNGTGQFPHKRQKRQKDNWHKRGIPGGEHFRESELLFLGVLVCCLCVLTTWFVSTNNAQWAYLDNPNIRRKLAKVYSCDVALQSSKFCRFAERPCPKQAGCQFQLRPGLADRETRTKDLDLNPPSNLSAFSFRRCF